MREQDELFIFKVQSESSEEADDSAEDAYVKSNVNLSKRKLENNEDTTRKKTKLENPYTYKKMEKNCTSNATNLKKTTKRK